MLRLGGQVVSAMQETARGAASSSKALRAREQELDAKEEAPRKSKKAKNFQAARARDAEWKVDAVKATSKQRLSEKKSAKEEVDMLRSEVDSLKEGLLALREGKTHKAHAEAYEKLQSMPTWQGVRAAGNCRGALQLEHKHRVAVMQQYGNGTPVSAIAANIAGDVQLAAPWMKPVEPNYFTVTKIGYELTTVEEVLSARQVAEAFALKLAGFDETSDLHEPFITSNVQVLMTEGAPFEIIILKAAYLSTKGGTSAAIVAEIEGKCFERLRDLLRRWKRYFEKRYPGEEWTGPDPERCFAAQARGGSGKDACA